MSFMWNVGENKTEVSEMWSGDGGKTGERTVGVYQRLRSYH
mgnify:CR=1 FL=1